MSIDSKINAAVKTVVAEVKPNLYTGTATEYCVYSYSEIPSVFADGKPDSMRYLVQVSLYLPTGKNPNTVKKNLANALFDAGFTYPSIVNASDSDGQQYVFECQGVDGNI